VHGKNGITGEAFKQAVVDHLLGTGQPLFCGLKNEVQGAIETGVIGQIMCRAKQHRGVAVMPAGMHDAFMLAAVRELRIFQDRQSIHICPNT
jgi:hypothetical protein